MATATYLIYNCTVNGTIQMITVYSNGSIDISKASMLVLPFHAYLPWAFFLTTFVVALFLHVRYALYEFDVDNGIANLGLGLISVFLGIFAASSLTYVESTIKCGLYEYTAVIANPWAYLGWFNLGLGLCLIGLGVAQLILGYLRRAIESTTL